MSAEHGAPGASKFVSQGDLSDAQKRREKEIREAYERIGEAPPAPTEEPYDPRPLFEEAKAIQDEKIEEMFKLRNQFRGLDESESQFLLDLDRARKEREVQKRREDAIELEAFRRATESKATTTASMPEKPDVPAVPKARPPSSAAKRKREQGAALGIVRKPRTQASEKSVKAESDGTLAKNNSGQDTKQK